MDLDPCHLHEELLNVFRPILMALIHWTLIYFVLKSSVMKQHMHKGAYTCTCPTDCRKLLFFLVNNYITSGI